MRRNWRKQFGIIFTLAMVLSGVSAVQAAAPPNIITYQGRVLNTNGVPVSDASLSMSFALYTATAGGTCLWSNSSATCATTTTRSVTLTTGLFTENLGDTADAVPYAAIADTVFGDNTAVYLEVIIAGETLTPRRHITAAPYALNAQRLDGIDSTGFLASDGDTGTGDYDLSGAELVGASPLVFEGGSNDGVTSTFAFTNPTVNRTITFQNSSGTVAFTSDISNLLEAGTNGSYEDDAAVIVGADVAFTYATGGVGDLQIADELAVMGDGFIDNDLVVGASTSSTETLTHTSFTLGGDDLFVAGTLGVEGVVYTDGGFTAGTDTTFGSGLITTTGTTDLLLTIAGGDLTFAQATVIGDGGDVLSIDSSDWDISTTGALTGIGAITMDGLLTGTAGVTITGATASLNASSNFNTNINTGTSTGAVAIGGTAGNTINIGTDNTIADTISIGSALDAISITADDWSMTDAGVLSLVSFGSNWTNAGRTVADLGIVTTVDINGGTIDGVTLGATVAGAGSFTTLSSTGVTTIGNNSATVAINSSDWDISAIGDFTGVGNITMDGDLNLSGGDFNVVLDAGDGVDISKGAAPTVDVFTINGGTSSTDSVEALNITYTVDDASGNVVDLSPTFSHQDDVDTAEEWNVIDINAFTATNSILSTNQTATIDAINIGNLTEAGTDAITSTAIEIGTGWDTDISFLNTTRADIRIVNGSSLGLSDTAGNDIFVLQDISNASNHSISIDADTALVFDSNADSDVDITTSTNEILRIQPNGSGVTVFDVDEDSGVQISASAAPAVDILSISNADFSSTTEGVNALSISHSTTNATSAAISIAPSFTGGATDGLSYNVLEITAFSTTNAAGTDTVRGINIGTLTDPGATINSSAIRIDAGWDIGIEFSNGEYIRSSSDGFISLHGAGGTNNTSLSIGLDNANGATLSTEGTTIQINDLLTVDLAAGGAGPAVCHTGADSDTDNVTLEDCSAAPISDYAEQYPAAQDVEYGDIVVPGTQQVQTYDEQTGHQTIRQVIKSSRAYQGPVIGIVSNNYGDFTSAGYNIAEEDNPIPVALVGRVPVNVSGEGGSIAAGDYLTTSSTAGHAMKATKVGRVIGMALEDWDGSSATVMVQVNNSWSMGEVLGTDGTSTLVTDNVIVSSVGKATASEPTFDSYGLALRGSAWNGSEAEAVEMMLQNVVDAHDEYRLSVRNTTETEVAYITNEGTMRIAGDMVIGGRVYPSDRGTPQTNKYIYYDGSSGAGGDFMRTNAKGWSTGSYDFAEMFPSGEELMSGDIVVFAGIGETVRRATGSGSERLAGIVSTRPGFLAGENVAGAYPIALAGRVPTKVGIENGVIAVGDPLAASMTAGVAMKAIEAGQVIGYALENYTGSESDNLILASVNVGYWSGGPQTTTIFVENTASQTPTSGTNSFSALNLSGNIYMATNQVLSIGRLEGVSGIWSIEFDGTIRTEGSLKTVTESYQGTDVETVAVTSPENVITLTGTSILVNGKAEVRFEDVLPEYNDVISAIAPTRIIVTPSGPVSLYVSEKDQNHFVVERFEGSADVEFDWMVTGYRKGFEPEEEEVEEVAPGFSLGESEEIVVPSVPPRRQPAMPVFGVVPPTAGSDLLALPVEPEPVTEEESVTEVEPEPAVESGEAGLGSAGEEPASPESPDETIIDSATTSDDGVPAEPTDVVIETPSTSVP